MIDPEIKTEIDKINKNLVAILHKTESIWRAFARGLVHGLGSVVGIAVAVLLIGWILNSMGIIPGLKEQANSWKGLWEETLEQSRKFR